MKKLGFIFFLVFLAVQAIATFSDDIRRESPFQGFRVFENPGRNLCRAEFSRLNDGATEFDDVRLTQLLESKSPRHAFQRFKIYHIDYARKLMEEACEANESLRVLRVDVRCQTDWGWGETQKAEVPCRR